VTGAVAACPLVDGSVSSDFPVSAASVFLAMMGTESEGLVISGLAGIISFAASEVCAVVVENTVSATSAMVFITAYVSAGAAVSSEAFTACSDMSESSASERAGSTSVVAANAMALVETVMDAASPTAMNEYPICLNCLFRLLSM
jgi:hypothetical protein